MAQTATMQRTELSSNSEGRTYYNQVTVADPDTESNAYLIPNYPIYAIGATFDDSSGVGTMEFTMDAVAMIVDDSATWETWDGLSAINLAATAWRITRTSGTLVGSVTVKARQA